MSNVVVQVQGLGKRYETGSRVQQNTTFRDALAARVRTLKSHLLLNHSRVAKLPKDKFWALQDISFEVRQGERLGVIGRNGAGKSTLLKLLTRITEPTVGRISIRGRVGSLLEVGTGFHPELSGRENIFLNGAILGMSRTEIKKKFDEIVAFSEVETFLDMPVKRYSSGMYVRLAFAVAAHFEPEILIVDEVLAVGDVHFQKKCLGKMNDVAKEGRTVLFVSHNMGAIRNLCSRCILLEHGRPVIDGTPEEAIDRYLSGSDARDCGKLTLKQQPELPIQATALWVEAPSGTPVSQIEMGTNAHLCIEYVVRKQISGVVVAALVSRSEADLLYSYDSDVDSNLLGYRRPGTYLARAHLPMQLFKEGRYYLSVSIGYGRQNLSDRDARIPLDIANTQRDLTHRSYRTDRLGFLFQEVVWETEKLA